MSKKMLYSRKCFLNSSVMPINRITFEMLGYTVKRLQILLNTSKNFLVFRKKIVVVKLLFKADRKDLNL
jgi:hypothetical protein